MLLVRLVDDEMGCYQMWMKLSTCVVVCQRHYEPLSLLLCNIRIAGSQKDDAYQGKLAWFLHCLVSDFI